MSYSFPKRMNKRIERIDGNRTENDKKAASSAKQRVSGSSNRDHTTHNDMQARRRASPGHLRKETLRQHHASSVVA